MAILVVMVEAALGWLGAGGTFLAYILVSRGTLVAESKGYALLNCCGGSLAATSAVLYEAWPSAVSNLLWAGIGLVTFITVTRKSSGTSADLTADTALQPSVVGRRRQECF